MAQWLAHLTKNREVSGSILDLLSGLRIQRCRELWCRLQTVALIPCCCGSGIGGRLSSHSTPSLGTPYAEGVAQDMAKRQKKPPKNQKNQKRLQSHQITSPFLTPLNIITFLQALFAKVVLGGVSTSTHTFGGNTVQSITVSSLNLINSLLLLQRGAEIRIHSIFSSGTV